MIRLLLGLQLTSVYKQIFRLNSTKAKKRGKIKSALFILLVLYVISTIMFSVGMMFWGLAEGLAGTELSWLYFSLVGLGFFGMSVLFSVFSAKSMIYEANDNDLLLSLPIKPGDILASRLLVIATLDIVTSLVFLLPAAGIYVYLARPAIWFYPVLLAGTLLLCVLSLAIVALLGYIVSQIMNRLQTRYKSLVTIIIYILFTGVYLVLYTNMSTNMAELLLNGASVAEVIKSYLPPFYYFGTVMIKFDLLSFIMLAVWCVVPFLAMYHWLSRKFISVITTSRHAKKLVYTPTKTKAGSAFSALLKKELAKFLSSPIYMMNCALAVPATIVFGIYILIKGEGVLAMLASEIPNIGDFVTPALVAVLCMLAAMTFTTAPSVSLEGKNLWILKSSPIKVSDIFRAKISLNLILGISALLFADLCILIRIRPMPLHALFIILLPISMQIFTALSGLMCNLLFPKFDAVSETIVVKQSMSVFLAVMISMGAIAALCISLFLISPKAADYPLFGLSWIVLLNILNAVLYKVIMTKGVKIFNSF